MVGRGAILLVDAARPEPIAGLLVDGRLTTRTVPRHDDDERGLRLFATLDDMMTVAKLTWTALGAVAVGVGPGPMNGTRLGLSVATGLCKALDVGVIALPAWYAYANVDSDEPQPLTVALGRSGFASADVTVSSQGWRYDNAVLATTGTSSPGPSDAALAQALLDNTPAPLEALRLIYLREPDVQPQFDAFGRPLAR